MPETIEDHVGYYTEKAGEICRQLGLAGIAAMWIFKMGNYEQTPSGIQTPSLPNSFYLPALFIIISLGIDAVQYLIGTFVWAQLWHSGAGARNPGDFKGRVITLLVIVTVKLSVLFVAYILLIRALIKMVRFV